MNVAEFDDGLWEFPATLVRLRDADTMEIDADLGFRAHYRPAIRLARIDAPESWTPAGKSATIWAMTALAGRPLRVRSLQLTTFDRWVSEVWVVEADGMMWNVSDGLVAEGHASYRAGSGPLESS